MTAPIKTEGGSVEWESVRFGVAVPHTARYRGPQCEGPRERVPMDLVREPEKAQANQTQEIRKGTQAKVLRLEKILLTMEKRI